VGADGENYLIVREGPFRRLDTLEGVGGYLNFAPPRQALERARSPGTYRMPQMAVCCARETAVHDDVAEAATLANVHFAALHRPERCSFPAHPRRRRSRQGSSVQGQ
jgi:hypothetical protein